MTHAEMLGLKEMDDLVQGRSEVLKAALAKLKGAAEAAGGNLPPLSVRKWLRQYQWFEDDILYFCRGVNRIAATNGAVPFFEEFPEE